MVARAGRTVRSGHRDRREPSASTHEIRDILARNNIPFGFYRSDSAEGRQALARLGVGQPAGPVVALYNGIVLVDPGNAELAEALGLDVRPSGQAYDVVIVGAGPAGRGAARGAAVYGASEGLATAVLELEAFGGRARDELPDPELPGVPARYQRRRVAGKPVFVVGGGNSAGQAALHLRSTRSRSRSWYARRPWPPACPTT